MRKYMNLLAMCVNKQAELKPYNSEAINKHGGTITIYDTIDLQLVRKP